MDKRTVLFVIGLSLTLFLVNLFFQYQNIQQKQEWLSQQKAREAQKNKDSQEEPAERTASLQSPLHTPPPSPPVLQKSKKRNFMFSKTSINNSYSRITVQLWQKSI